MTTTVSIYCLSEEWLLRKKLRALVWDAAQDSQASFKGPEMVSEASRLQIPDVRARDGKHDSCDAPKNGGFEARKPKWFERLSHG